MKIFTTLAFCCIGSLALAQSSKKTFVITADPANPITYNRISAIDANGGKSLGDLFQPGKKYFTRNNSSRSYQLPDQNADGTKLPIGGSIAGMAYDAKSNRLFYIPMQVSELRYMDLKESEPSFTCLENQAINLLHNPNDVANQVTRMAIGSDGFGYALSNDAEHLIKFSTQGTPVIQDLGVLVDNPKNQVFVRSSCTSWGGDMVAGADGNLYLITLHNHVFKIALPNKNCDYIGTIKGLPEEFNSNGASVDENGDLLVSCGSSYGKKFSPIYKVKWSTLEASEVNTHVEGLGNISDLASSNLLFQSTQDKSVNSPAVFIQTVEADNANTPSIGIFPNPVSHGRFTIKTSNMEKGDYKMRLMDANGKAVMEATMNIGTKTSNSSFSLPSRNAKGVYFIQVSDVFNRTVFSQQLIVE